jgi:peptidoglycan/xylan/chitin deacetylase (PgdA/CDA1 family)
MIFRNDDIFLTESPRGYGVYYDFEKFKASHELLKGHDHLLAINAAEIENYPELKNYILYNRHDFLFGVHGWSHERYSEWNEEAIYQSLKRAKEKIERTFNENVEWFLPPWNKRNEAMYRACERLDLKVNDSFIVAADLGEKESGVCCFHYWNEEEMSKIKEYVHH